MEEKTNEIDDLKRRVRELEKENARLGRAVKDAKCGLVWIDCPEAFDSESERKIPVLAEVPDKAISNDDGKPTHILIEGDNYHALTCLNFTHRGKIDVIYIDPPYNTGSDGFTYKDRRFLDKYPNGEEIKKDHPKRHSAWLSFMEKRLRLAKDLLSNRGVIFISIDDNEQANLKLLCDKVFGEPNFVAIIPWRKRTAKADVPHKLSQDYEWILCYAKPGFNAGISKDSRKYYETPDFPGRPWRVHDMTTQRNKDERPNCYFTIVNPKNGEKYKANPKRVWANNEDTFQLFYAVGRIVFPGDYDFLNITKPVLRYFKEDDERKAGEFFGFTAASTDLPNEVGMTQDGTKDLDAIFGEKVFPFPKPVSLIQHLIRIATPGESPCATILDFFAGSGTTMHAVSKLNMADGGKRQCILCTNNEQNICKEVTYPRSERVINGFVNHGTVTDVLFSEKLSVAKLKKSDQLLNEANRILDENAASYQSLKTEIRDGTLVVTGEQKKGETVPGLGGSLKYYRTAFVGKRGCRDALDADKSELAANAGTMLALAEGTLDVVPVPEGCSAFWQRFTDGKHCHTFIYFSDNLGKFPEMAAVADEIRAADGEARLAVYVFLIGGDVDVFREEFDNAERLDIKPIPQPILDIYKTVNEE